VIVRHLRSRPRMGRLAGCRHCGSREHQTKTCVTGPGGAKVRHVSLRGKLQWRDPLGIARSSWIIGNVRNPLANDRSQKIQEVTNALNQVNRQLPGNGEPTLGDALAVAVHRIGALTIELAQQLDDGRCAGCSWPEGSCVCRARLLAADRPADTGSAGGGGAGSGRPTRRRKK
jgi:hypothetical protein